MSEFRKLSDDFYASPQITPQEVSEAAAMGIALVINNRPDGEAPDQPAGADIEAATRAAGMDYLAIPIGSAGFSEPQVEKLQEALAASQGPVLGYCRSGTRSTLLWSLAQARGGGSPDSIAEVAAEAGYDVAPVRPAMDMFAARAKA
jgi:uncharacterized protein (TIGR01244 family)